jgi:hypothetical protein
MKYCKPYESEDELLILLKITSQILFLFKEKFYVRKKKFEKTFAIHNRYFLQTTTAPKVVHLLLL